MRPIFKASILAAAAMLAGCSGATLTYPIFPAETTGPRARSFEPATAFETGAGVPRDYDRAISAYRAAAAAGDARAENNLGVMAMHGRGGRSDPGLAMSHFRKAAARGSSAGHYNVGLLYDTGIGVGQDPRAAAYEYRMAAEMGHALAQQRLAQMLEGGQGVPPSPAEAKRLYAMAAVSGDQASLQRIEVLNGTNRRGLDARRAAQLFAVENCDCTLSAEKAMAERGVEELRKLAARGDAPARYNLGVRLLKAESSHHDPSEAARLFTLAARQGYAPAQRQLANMHLRGQAVARSKVLAHSWLNLAAKGTGSEAAAARAAMEDLEVTMTTAEVREAQAIAARGAVKGR